MTAFQVADVDETAERRRRRRRAAGWLVVGATALAVGGGLAWYYTPPAMPTTVAQAEALVSSPRFTRLSKKQKQPYQDVIREQFGSLDRDARRAMARENQELAAALREARHVQMEAFLRKYTLATPAERAALLAEMPWRRGSEGRGGPGRGDGAGSKGRRGGGEGRSEGEAAGAARGERMRERIGERLTEGSAQTSQLIGELFSQRRAQRGR